MRAFRLTVEQADIFFELCDLLKANTEQQRVQILDAMAELGSVEGIVDTPMSKDEYIEHLSKHFGKVVNITDSIPKNRDL